MVQECINLDGINFVDGLFGSYDENINLLQERYCVNIVVRGGKLKIFGEEKGVFLAKKAVEYILTSLKRGEILTKQNVEYILNCNGGEQLSLPADSFKEQICVNFKNKPILTKTLAQKIYLNLIEKNTITFAVGPAGTGKTYIAVAKAINAFKNKLVDKIILTRPVVEAGENLGFLPGDFQSKIDPYLRPLYDIIEQIIGIDSFNKYLERRKIEIVPLAYMRGRTLGESFIILDEAQNTTFTQMKMFLTRFGSGSKMVVTGDVTQIDLADRSKSGLLDAINVLNGVESIAIINFENKDIVRHEIVQKIIRAYESSSK